MSEGPNRNGVVTEPAITRRRMLMRLGLAATAVYAAPVLLQLSEARASGFSGSSSSGPARRGQRRHPSRASGPSFSGGRERQPIHADQFRRRRRIYASSFSG